MARATAGGSRRGIPAVSGPVSADVARLALRLVIGSLFVGHGGQKLFGWFGGSGIEGTAAEMDELALHPARASAIAAGVSQLGGGLSVAAGLATPVGCAALGATMITAMRTACAGNGLWERDGGYEYPMVLTVALLLIAAEGPGAFSVDRLFRRERPGAGIATATLATALVGSTPLARELVGRIGHGGRQRHSPRQATAAATPR